jgi:hypothetical protein
MKIKLMAALFLLNAVMAFAQKLSVVAVFPFEAGTGGVSPGDAGEITRRLISELESWGTLTVIEPEGDRAENAEYLIRGQLSRSNNALVLSAVTYNGKSGKALNSSKEQAASLSGLLGNIFSFCVQVVDNIPFPNYLIGKWKSVVNLGDSLLICIMEFKSNRTVLIEQYDTFEHRGDTVLKYQGYGKGSYSYSGHVRRVLAFKDARGVVYREAPVDGSVNISLSLEDALSKYDTLSRSRISLAFDEEKNNFEMISSGLLCGENFGGPGVYPQTPVAYTHFTKIQ